MKIAVSQKRIMMIEKQMSFNDRVRSFNHGFPGQQTEIRKRNARVRSEDHTGI